MHGIELGVPIRKQARRQGGKSSRQSLGSFFFIVIIFFMGRGCLFITGAVALSI